MSCHSWNLVPQRAIGSDVARLSPSVPNSIVKVWCHSRFNARPRSRVPLVGLSNLLLLLQKPTKSPKAVFPVVQMQKHLSPCFSLAFGEKITHLSLITFISIHFVFPLFFFLSMWLFPMGAATWPWLTNEPSPSADPTRRCAAPASAGMSPMAGPALAFGLGPSFLSSSLQPLQRFPLSLCVSASSSPKRF